MSAKSTSKTSVIGEDDPTKRALDGHEGEPSLLEEEAAYQSTTAVRNGDDIISSERGENQEGKDSEEAGAGEQGQQQQQQLLTQQELRAQQQLQAQQELRAQQELQAQLAQRLLAAAANTAIAPVNDKTTSTAVITNASTAKRRASLNFLLKEGTPSSFESLFRCSTANRARSKSFLSPREGSTVEQHQPSIQFEI